MMTKLKTLIKTAMAIAASLYFFGFAFHLSSTKVQSLHSCISKCIRTRRLLACYNDACCNSYDYLQKLAKERKIYYEADNAAITFFSFIDKAAAKYLEPIFCCIYKFYSSRVVLKKDWSQLVIAFVLLVATAIIEAFRKNLKANCKSNEHESLCF